MKNGFIPIEVYKKYNKKEIWYIDLNAMSLSQLTELRKELLGTISTRYFDGVINDIARDVISHCCNNKQAKRQRKYRNMLMKKKTSNFRKGRR